MTTIGVVGMGVVGRAVASGFRSRGHRVLVNDVRELRDGVDKRTLVQACDYIFICVPTPTNPSGIQDSSLVVVAVSQLAKVAESEQGTNPVIVVKSTVLPGTVSRLSKDFPMFSFAANPEFMRENHPDEFLHPDMVVVGGDEKTGQAVCDLYLDWDTPVVVQTDATSAELIKYMVNAFLVMRVAYAEHIWAISRALGLDALTVYHGIAADKRIGHSHLHPDKGKIARSSPCLPKDLDAFITFLRDKNVDPVFFENIRRFGIERKG